ncbi:MAG: GAF domain-containing protein, partial [Armatimonadetes bacterium]|nr:GAF domain-containing protein [Anaerolineae bacterium]
MDLTHIQVKGQRSSQTTQHLTFEQLTQRGGLAIALAFSVGALVALVIYLVLALQWRAQPFIGVMLNNSMTVNRGQPTGAEPWNGRDAGLLPGSHILSINGEVLTENSTDYAAGRAALARIVPMLTVGEIISVGYSRPDGSVDAVRYFVQSFPANDFFVFFVIPFAAAVVVVGLGLAMLYLRRDQPGAVAAATVCMMMAIFMAGFFDAGTTMLLPRVWLLAAALAGGAMVMMGLVFPTPSRWLLHRPLLQFAPLGVGLVVGLIALMQYDVGAPSTIVQGVQLALGMFIIGALTLMGLVIFKRQRATNRQIRDQASLVLIGLVLSFAPGLIWLGSQALQAQQMSIALEAMMPFLVTAVLGITVAVFQSTRLDTDWLLSRAATYGVLMVALVMGYFLLTLGASIFAAGVLTRAEISTHPLIIALMLFIVAVMFIPVRTYLQTRIDEVYFRRRRDYQTKLEAFSRDISMSSDNLLTIQAFRNTVESALSATGVFVFLPSARGTGEFIAYGSPKPQTDVVFAPDSGVVELLSRGGDLVYLEPNKPLPTELLIDRARLGILKTTILAGLVTDNTLIGIVSIGAARSGDVYTYEALRFVNAIVDQLVIATERAQVIASLERRVRELDVLSQVGQAVNFTIEFDDLLELISTRTSRLIEAAHFYIALYEKPTNQLYFAFYLENDERYAEYEGNRWVLGTDLFSEIVKTGQPRRVDDYAKATTEGGYAPLYDNEAVRAWMGVPLIAGANILGAMAVGKAKSDEGYTPDQLRIFSNIGALAATSIEKARLFGEVNVRARQLAALNEISQLLVQAEAGEIEELLTLVTTSAVRILNTDAGSLLLEADDDPNYMQFRVAVGGTGAELVGTRIKANHGLVGEVVKTKKYAISDDTSHDDRWKGEVAGGFRTNSILAVPLVVKDRIIGVLEVLNKKDSTPFVQEEVELLTTFAGQAAIAIENTRLFQMTGSQLNQRLEELETLERIDFELNRTLDLQRVAEITLKWSVA